MQSSLRIVAWNIQHGGGRRVPALQEYLSAWQPDVCVLVEYRANAAGQALEQHLRSLGLSHVVRTVDDTHGPQNGLLIAARWPLHLLPVVLDGASPARWRLTRIEHPQAPFALGAVHVPNRDSAQDAKRRTLGALVALAQAWTHGPGLLIGDFNTGRRGIDEEAPFFNLTEERFMLDMARAGWSDAFRQLHGSQRAYSWWNRNRGRVTGFRLDHAFLSPDLHQRLTRCELLFSNHQWSSDHAALVLELGPIISAFVLEDRMVSFPTHPTGTFRVSDLTWLVGAWHGTHQTELIDEYWSVLRANSLMGMFRWLRQHEVWFYEFMSIEAASPGVVLRIKHFNPGLLGWEEKHESKEFLLVDLREHTAIFFQQQVTDPLWLIYDLQAEDRLVSYFARPEGVSDEAEHFVFQRLPAFRDTDPLTHQ